MSLKKFLCYIPLQEILRYVSYQAVDNQKLHYGNAGEAPLPAAFPILPVLNGYMEPGEEIEILALVNDYGNSHRNYEVFAQEASALCEKRGAKLRNQEITKILVPYESGIDSILTGFDKLLDRLEDGDEIYACVTFGTKPSSIIEVMALRYARLFLKDVYIACVAYGGLDHITKKACIYDVTALVQMDDIIRMLAQGGANNPREAIRRILLED